MNRISLCLQRPRRIRRVRRVRFKKPMMMATSSGSFVDGFRRGGAFVSFTKHGMDGVQRNLGTSGNWLQGQCPAKLNNKQSSRHSKKQQNNSLVSLFADTQTHIFWNIPEVLRHGTSSHRTWPQPAPPGCNAPLSTRHSLRSFLPPQPGQPPSPTRARDSP